MSFRIEYYGNFMMEIFRCVMNHAGMESVDIESCGEFNFDRNKKIENLLKTYYKDPKDLYTLFWEFLNCFDRLEHQIKQSRYPENIKDCLFYLKIPDDIFPIARSWLSRYFPPLIDRFYTIQLHPVLRYISKDINEEFLIRIGVESCAVAFVPIGKRKACDFVQNLDENIKNEFWRNFSCQDELPEEIAQKLLLQNVRFSDQNKKLFMQIGCSIFAGSLTNEYQEIIEDVVFMNPTDENYCILGKFQNNSFTIKEGLVLHKFLNTKNEIKKFRISENK